MQRQGIARHSAFPDYVHDRLWLFGIDFNRCNGTHKGTSVFAFWNTHGGANLASWSSAVAIPGFETYNVEVAYVNNSEPATAVAAVARDPDACFAEGRALCNADPHCAAFGTHGGTEIQLHGCVAIVPDSNPWRIYNRSGGYGEVGDDVNVDEHKCVQHAATMTHPCGGAPPRPLPPHNYVMILEPFYFMVNNATDGNLTRGWTQIHATTPPAPSGGPSLRHSRGFYYILTGGDQVRLLRTADFQSYDASPRGSLMFPTPEVDGRVAPFAGFDRPASTEGGQANETNAQRKKFDPLMEGPANAAKWDHNSNDGDVCCMEPGSTESWFIWGASTQGRPCGLPHCESNAIGHAANMSLPDLLEAMFA